LVCFKTEKKYTLAWDVRFRVLNYTFKFPSSTGGTHAGRVFPSRQPTVSWRIWSIKHQARITLSSSWCHQFTVF